jgi:endonuclease VIII
VPEGDTIAYAANRIRPVLCDQVPDEILAPRNPTWPERLAGRAVRSVDTHGKNLFIHFEGGLVLHSHLGMVGSWRVLTNGRIGPSAWLLLGVGDRQVVQFKGPTLELLTEGRMRFDQRLAGLGPDVLAASFDSTRFLKRLRQDDPTRAFGDALLDQRNVAGIGNIWKAEGCWEAAIDPWRPLREISDEEALAVIEAVRPRMMRSAQGGPRAIDPRVYRMTGRPCARCGSRIRSRAGGGGRSPSRLATTGSAPRPSAGDANRTTYWCPGCQH